MTRGKALKKITYTLLKKSTKKIRKIKKNQLKNQEKIKSQKNLVRLFSSALPLGSFKRQCEVYSM